MHNFIALRCDKSHIVHCRTAYNFFFFSHDACNTTFLLILLTSVILQVSILDEAACVHPNTWCWIKANGANVVSRFGESVAGVWSGDVDLADKAATNLLW